MGQHDPEMTLDEMKASVGKERAALISAPIGANDIRRHAIAVFWPETPPRLFWDKEYAAQTTWGGIVASQDFNPFAWPISGPSRLPTPPGFVTGARILNAGTEVEYGVRMRPGDVITAVDRVTEINERTGRSGRMLFVVSESVWHNQRGEWVKTLRNTRVNVLP